METEPEKIEEVVADVSQASEKEETKVEGEGVEQSVSPEVKEKKKWECKLLTLCKENNRIAILSALVLLIVLMGGLAFFRYYKKNNVGAEAIKSKIETLLKDQGGEVNEVVIDGDLFKVTISIAGKEQPSFFVTKDGKKLIQDVITFEEIEKQKAEAKKQEEESNRPIPKAEKPRVDLYVMSFCPYGNKAEDTMKPVYDLLKNKVDFNFHYIVTVEGNDVQSLHGPTEVTQNEREACVLRDYGKDKWFAFVSYVNSKCGSDGSCWETGAKSLGLNSAKINDCVSKDGLSLMTANGEASTEAGASGSPTMIINGISSKVAYQYGKPETYKKAICDAFNVAPAECAKVLADQTASATAQGGSCN
ncbi:MAG: hypothetical protein HGA61_01255 [Candidatus Moranbacteria bacterium]|nr:hypothetical protein [Candidatus Moranbacteria bacterium]